MFKVLTKGCEPTRGSKYSACVDLYASKDALIGAGETKLIGLGVAIDEELLPKTIVQEWDKLGLGMYIDYVKDFKKSHYLQLMLRSSLGKKGLILPNGVGIIDLDYKDEIKMIIHNPIKMVDAEYFADEEVIEMSQLGSPSPYSKGENITASSRYEIRKGDKIAQITLLEHKGYLFGIDTDKEREGGFGSTGE